MSMVTSLLPSIILFDLDQDFILWPFWIDVHVTSPFFGKGQKIVDSAGQSISCYEDVPRILDMLHRRGIRMGIASRITDTKGASQLMDAFDWSKFFTYYVTHPGAVTTHIKQIHLVSGIPYNEMLYFNDEPRDLHQVERMGVVTHLVKLGLDLATIRNGIDRYEKNKTRGPHSQWFEPQFRSYDKPFKPREDRFERREGYETRPREDKFERREESETRPREDRFDRREESETRHPFTTRSHKRFGDKLQRFRRPQKDAVDEELYEPQDDTYDRPYRHEDRGFENRPIRPGGDKFDKPYMYRPRGDGPFERTPRHRAGGQFQRTYQFQSATFNSSEYGRDLER